MGDEAAPQESGHVVLSVSKPLAITVERVYVARCATCGTVLAGTPTADRVLAAQVARDHATEHRQQARQPLPFNGASDDAASAVFERLRQGVQADG